MRQQGMDGEPAEKLVALNSSHHPAWSSEIRKDAPDPDTSDNRRLDLSQRQLLESYERCRMLGIDTALQSFTDVPSCTIPVFVHRTENFVSRAREIFSDTFRYLPNRQDIFILADDRRCVLELHTAPELSLGIATKHQLRIGASFDEYNCGTNVVDLSLRHHAEFILPGNLHYCQVFQPWCWAAVPIVDRDGVTVGCIAVATDHQPYWLRSERLALVRLMVRELIGGIRYQSSNAESEMALPEPLRQRSPTVILSPRQQQVLALFAQGLSYKKIARALGLGSAKTVEEHLDAVRTKLNAKHRRECIQKAMTLGLLDTPLTSRKKPVTPDEAISLKDQHTGP